MNHEQFCHWLAGYLANTDDACGDTEAAVEWGKILRAELAKVLVPQLGEPVIHRSVDWGSKPSYTAKDIFPGWIPYTEQQRYAAERLKTQQAMAEQMRDMPLPSPGPLRQSVTEQERSYRGDQATAGQRITELELLHGKLETRVQKFAENGDPFPRILALEEQLERMGEKAAIMHEDKERRLRALEFNSHSYTAKAAEKGLVARRFSSDHPAHDSRCTTDYCVEQDAQYKPKGFA